jgi:hypothetical protein
MFPFILQAMRNRKAESQRDFLRSISSTETTVS